MTNQITSINKMNFKLLTNCIVYLSIICGVALMAYVNIMRADAQISTEINTNHKDSKKITCSKSAKLKNDAF